MTKTAGIIGYPLGHTVSPAFQQAAFRACGMDARYLVWETTPAVLEARITSLHQPDVLGANVTVPHKETVMPFLDSLSQEAQRIGAVNTIVSKDGTLIGHNTDVAGFLRALREDGAFDLEGKNVLVLGAGGAARAVVYALTTAGVASITVANRSVERARHLIQSLGSGTNAQALPLEPQALGRQPKWDLVVNCTTMGMRHGPAEGETPLDTPFIPSGALVYDLVYNPQETPLLRAAARAGARTLGGLPMLVYQGAASFRLWTGRDPPVAVMLKAAHTAIQTLG